MKMRERPEVYVRNYGADIIIRTEYGYESEIQSVFDEMGEFDKDIDYELKIVKKRKKRSLNANAYMWVLADKIAEVIHSTKEDVYRDAVRKVGAWQDVAVQNGEPYIALVKSWTANGIGWMTDTFDSTLTDKYGNGMKRVRLYNGSSQYDTKQMSRLIDWIVEEAKGLGIETMTAEEIQQLKEMWNDGR